MPSPPRILFFTRILPEPGSSGTGTYSFDLLSYLRSRGCEIRVVWTTVPYEMEVCFRSRIPATVTTAFDVRARGSLRLGGFLFRPDAVLLPLKARFFHLVKRTFALGIPRLRANASGEKKGPLPENAPPWDQPATQAETDFLEEHSRSFRPHIILVNYPWMLEAIRAVSRPSSVWLLTHDFRLRRCQLSEEDVFSETFSDALRIEKEKSILDRADLLIAIQEKESAAFSRLMPGKEVVTACMAVTPKPLTFRERSPVCVFVGSSNEANKRAAVWFITKVWPQVLADMPQARFLVVGRVCEVLPKDIPLAGVQLLGKVFSLDDVYASSAIAVIPLREGSGVKIKLLEAIAHSLPSVTTSVGIDGVEFLSPFLKVADSADAFAQSIVSWLADSGQLETASAALQVFTRERLSPDACYGALLARAQDIAASRA